MELVMNDNSNTWQAEIEELSSENAAKILSVVLGITSGEAADRLLENEPMGAKTGFRQAVALARILGTELHTTSKIQSYRTGISSHPQFVDSFPTLSQWLQVNPKRLAILRSGQHFIYVGWGQRLAGVAPSKGRAVTHVIFLDEEG